MPAAARCPVLPSCLGTALTDACSTPSTCWHTAAWRNLSCWKVICPAFMSLINSRRNFWKPAGREAESYSPDPEKRRKSFAPHLQWDTETHTQVSLQESISVGEETQRESLHMDKHGGKERRSGETMKTQKDCGGEVTTEEEVKVSIQFILTPMEVDP